MQKVEGSSPFSRFKKARKGGPFVCSHPRSSVACPETVSRTSSFNSKGCRIRVLGPADYECRICRAFGSTKRFSRPARSRYLALDLPSWEHGGNTADSRNIGGRPADAVRSSARRQIADPCVVARDDDAQGDCCGPWVERRRPLIAKEQWAPARARTARARPNQARDGRRA